MHTFRLFVCREFVSWQQEKESENIIILENTSIIATDKIIITIGMATSVFVEMLLLIRNLSFSGENMDLTE